jgi:flavin-dependent dehydrogenase
METFSVQGLEADVAVVGLGTAGAAVAAFLAEGGLSVVALDRRPLTEAGARWVNGVPAWMFDQARVAPPVAPELRGGGHPFHLVCGHGPERVVLGDTGVLEVDMRLLVSRLQERARVAGARLLGEVRVLSREGDLLETSAGTLRATHVIDASGLGGSGLLPASGPAPKHVCAAAQAVHEVTDLGAAQAYMARHEIAPGETLCFTGIAGGFSILNLRLHGDSLSILTGSIPALGHPAGKSILDTFVESEPWVGERVFGGARAIPLSRPVDRIVEGSVALLGDSARQVFTVHGSGIGIGLVAARVLADTLCAGEPLESYRVKWMRSYGALQATYEVFRRFSAELTVEEIRALVEAGLMNAKTAGPTLAQRWPAVDPSGWLKSGLGALKVPALGARLAGVGARMALVRALYAIHPRDPKRVASWARRVERALPLQ